MNQSSRSGITLNRQEQLLLRVLYFLYKFATVTRIISGAVATSPSFSMSQHLVKEHTTAQQKRELKTTLILIGAGVGVHSMAIIISGGVMLALYGLIVFEVLGYPQPEYYIYLLLPLHLASFFMWLGIGLFIKGHSLIRIEDTSTRDFAWRHLTPYALIGLLWGGWLV